MKYFLDQTGIKGVLKKIQDSFVRSGGVRLTNTDTGTMRETASFENDISGQFGEVSSICGNTIQWNQMVDPAKVLTHSTTRGITPTNNGDGTVTVTGTATGGDVYFNITQELPITYDPTHIYLLRGCPKGGDLATYNIRYNVNGFGETGDGVIITGTAKPIDRFMYVFKTGVSFDTPVVFKPQIFDLTMIFGAGNEPTTVAEFEELYPLDYYDYDAGSLKNVHVDSIRTIGFNALNIDSTEAMSEITYDQNQQRDFEENTFIVGMSRNNMINKDNIYDGEITNNTVKCTGANAFGICFPIKILEKVDYQITGDIVTGSLGIGWFDINGNLLSHYNITAYGNIVTSPAGAAGALVAVVNDENGTCEISNLCFHLVHSGVKNGVYEPYAAYNKSINTDEIIADGLKSVAAGIYDELTPTKLIRRVGSVDLGTLIGTKRTNTYVSETRYFGTANFSGNVRTDSYQMRCVNYTPTTQGNISGANGLDKHIAVSSNTTVGILLTNSTFDNYTADQVKAALNGEYLYYDYLTPVETVFETPLDGTYVCEDFGTEEGIFPSDIPAPHPTFSSTIKYGSNFTDTLRRLSDIYVSHAELSDELKSFSTKLDGYAPYVHFKNTDYPGPMVQDLYDRFQERGVNMAIVESSGYFQGKFICSIFFMGAYNVSLLNLETNGFSNAIVSGDTKLHDLYSSATSGYRTDVIDEGESTFDLTPLSGTKTLNVNTSSLFELYLLPEVNNDPGPITVYFDGEEVFQIYPANVLKDSLQGGLIMKRVGNGQGLYVSEDGCGKMYSGSSPSRIVLHHGAGTTPATLYVMSHD